MPWGKPPNVDFEQEPQYQWPFWLVGLDEDDLFGDLYERFNTTSIFIQDGQAFHKDVSEVAYRSSSKEDFYARLRIRRDERLEELKSFIRALCFISFSGHSRFNPEQSNAYNRFNIYGSVDSIIAFVSTFLGPNERGELPSESRHALWFNGQRSGPFFGHPDMPTDSRNPTPNATERTASPAHQGAQQIPQASTSKKRSWQMTDVDETGHDTNSHSKRQCKGTDASTIRGHVLDGTQNQGMTTTKAPFETQKESNDARLSAELAVTNGPKETDRPSGSTSTDHFNEPNERERTLDDEKEQGMTQAP
ncbi:hypothetical protein E4U42_007630 [Claviceps africana]|uniref:Uncharacterized protein n=1 Tax=Claviceps africana TaxID=83212 RepID=A0A8K0JD23_9HYPO|nr:hypothetical protein E4U42_007630 [Claviceps africana]